MVFISENIEIEFPIILLCEGGPKYCPKSPRFRSIGSIRRALADNGGALFLRFFLLENASQATMRSFLSWVTVVQLTAI
jgi:hypothetical protein